MTTHVSYAHFWIQRGIPAHRQSHLWQVAFHLGLVAGGYGLIRVLPLIAAPFCAVLLGHSIACLGFLAHDISHHAVVRSRLATRLLELLLFETRT